ncbi:MAG TPA: DUF3300 domain-containing protein [Vicinamibacterales bacterium]|jgi:hypothetical protein
MKSLARIGSLSALFLAASAVAASAQAPLPPLQPPPSPSTATAAPLPPEQAPPAFAPAELDRIVTPIALYPDPLLAQVLAAATYTAQIPDAARWADEHHSLTGAAMTAAIAEDQVTWDPSVQALLPFPSVLDMMASSMPWTEELGNAFLAQRADVMDAVQRMRRQAVSFGYLRPNAQVVVNTTPYVEILPVNPAFVVVPYYNPAVVFVAPRPGFHVAAAISFGYGVSLGAVWAPWGWGGATHFQWATHGVIVANAPWNRTWANRVRYVHPYAVRRYDTRAVESHRAVPRSPTERRSQWQGHPSHEEHRR